MIKMKLVNDDETLQTLINSSYRNFHRKGFDYICIERTPTLMKKVYFFGEDITVGDDIVNPHDHRYVFGTNVLAGVISNSFYEEDAYGEVYNQFHWRTPLLGGTGHEWHREARLLETKRKVMRAGQMYFMDVNQMHTIRIHRPDTVIQLDCSADVIPEPVPTSTYMRDREVPKLDGLYDRFTEDGWIARYQQYLDIINRF